MTSKGFHVSLIELTIVGDDDTLRHTRGRVVDSIEKIAELSTNPDVDGYSKGDYVRYVSLPEHPFPLIVQRLGTNHDAEVVLVAERR